MAYRDEWTCHGCMAVTGRGAFKRVRCLGCGVRFWRCKARCAERFYICGVSCRPAYQRYMRGLMSGAIAPPTPRKRKRKVEQDADAHGN